MCILCIKLYGVGLLYLLHVRSEVRGDYQEFLHRSIGELPEDRLAGIQSSFFERLAPYDGQYYLDIAHKGYRAFPLRDQATFESLPRGNYAFFPALPSILRTCSLLPWSEHLSVFVLNIIFSTMGAWGVWLIATREGIPAWRAVLLLEAFPTTVFRSLIYTESLFLALLTWCYLFQSAGRQRPAVLLGVALSLTKPQGILAVLLLLPKNILSSFAHRRYSLALAFVPALGLSLFMLHLWSVVGDPLAFIKVQEDWGREPSLSGLADLLSYSGPPLDVLGTLFALSMLPVLWLKLPRRLFYLAAALTAMPLATGSILSMGRFVSVSFPLFLGLASLRSGICFWSLLFIFLSYQALIARAALEWRFIG